MSLDLYDVAVVGAGASGMMSAIVCSEKYSNVIIFERNSRVGMKLGITGKGRCNLTNNCDVDEFLSSVVKNRKFLYSSVNTFSPYDTMCFFENLGVKLKTERGNRVFPVSDKALDIVFAMKRKMLANGCKLLHKTIDGVFYDKEKKIFCLLSNNQNIAKCKKLILSCGGVSYPKTGSDGLGFKLAQQLGHSVTKLTPSLVPIICENNCSIMQGLSLKNISIRVRNKKNNKIVYNDFGEMLFTHFGLSGPVILSASSHMKDIDKKAYQIIIDLKPALTEEQLDKRLQREFSENNNKNFSNILKNLLPHKLIPYILNMCSIDSETKCNSITKIMRQNFVSLLKNLVFDVCGFRPIDEAIITSGGINVKEINPKNMQSKILEGLYFTGEMIDVDAYTGGYNLQIAFSTGYLAGQSV